MNLVLFGPWIQIWFSVFGFGFGLLEKDNLTMVGRINVIKSLLFSQILYLGSFLMPSPSKLKNMQKSLDDFALDGTNIARDRITQPVEMGGLGLFDIEKFLTGQQASWVFKAQKSSRDNWRYKLRSF